MNGLKVVLRSYFRLIDEHLLKLNADLANTSHLEAQSTVRRLMTLMEGANAMVDERYDNADN